MASGILDQRAQGHRGEAERRREAVGIAAVAIISDAVSDRGGALFLQGVPDRKTCTHNGLEVW